MDYFFQKSRMGNKQKLKRSEVEGPSHIVDSIRVAGIVAPFQSCQQITTSNSDPTSKQCPSKQKYSDLLFLTSNQNKRHFCTVTDFNLEKLTNCS
jgi:hypothetical protein